MTDKTKLSPVWLKAAITGSLWASSEIILGSFLHNLHIPFAGTILSSIGIILLAASSKLWNEKGIIWRAGIICAVMKTISPSADILGPMVSIVAEAFILDFILRVLGNNFFGYILGGGLAVSWSLFYKIINLIILYGFNIIELYARLYKFSMKQLNLPDSSPLMLILFLFLIYMMFGGIAAFIGLRTGSNPQKADDEINSQTTGRVFDFSFKSLNLNFSLTWMAFHIISIIIGLVFLGTLSKEISYSFVFIYLAICFFRYKDNLNRLKKLKFWIIFIIITLLSGILLSELKDNSYGLKWSGISIGIEMNIRAFLMVFGFSSLSIELRNPKIGSWFKKKGMGQFSASLEAAFSILPFMVAGVSEEKYFIKHPLNSISKLIGKADLWLEKISILSDDKPVIFILSGEKGSGKTTFLTNVVTKLETKGLKIGGILAPGYWKENKRFRFDVTDISTNETTMLCSIYKEVGDESIGDFNFTSTGLSLGREALSPERIKDKDIVVIDEAGQLELNNKGWAESIRQLKLKFNNILVIVIRKKLVNEVLNYFELKDYLLFEVENNDHERFADEIFRKLMELKERPSYMTHVSKF